MTVWSNLHRLGLIAADVQRLVAIRPKAQLVVVFDVERRMRRLWLSGRRFGPTDIDGRRIKGTLDMRGVELLDHFDAGAAVFGDLVDVGTLHQPHTDVGMA